MQYIDKKVCNMSISSFGARVEFPKKENAVAFIPRDSLPFKEAIIGVTYPFPEYRIHRSSDFQINVFEYVLKGEGEIMLDGVWKSVREGDIYILRAGEEHNYRSQRKDPLHKIWINYTADYMLPLLDSYRIESGIYRSRAAVKYFDELHRDFLNQPSVSSRVFEIAKCVNNIVSSLSAEKNSHAEGDAYTIRRILDGSVYGSISLDDLSDEMHMSKSNIIRVFKREFGITPYTYLLDLKIEASKILLESTKMTVKEIADRVGIYDSHYFSNLFYKHIGVRPRDFRKECSK